jgi:hypothetical protein
LASILDILIIILDFAISVWNAYASGFNIGMLKKTRGKPSAFQEVSSYAGLGLAFIGMSYVLAIVLSFAGASFGYIDPGTVDFILAFDFLVFGILIIGLGIIITIQSIIIASQRKSIGNILGVVWNAFAGAWDIYAYASGFKQSVDILRREDRERETDALIVIIVAVLISFFIVYAAYKHGYNKALEM